MEARRYPSKFWITVGALLALSLAVALGLYEYSQYSVSQRPFSVALPPDTLLVVGTDVNKDFWDSAAAAFGLRVVYWDPSAPDYSYRLYIGPVSMPLMPPLFINPSFACYSMDLNRILAGYGQSPQIANLLRYCGSYTCFYYKEDNAVYCYPNGNEYFKFPVREVNVSG